MITIRNQSMTVQISEQGAEIKSISSDGVEYIWNSDPKFWAQSAPIMFPICGGLKNGRYELEGKTYEMPKHGFAKLNTFCVEKMTDESVTLLLCSNESTRAMYPFDFEFRASFSLDNDRVIVTYEVKNKDNKAMYFSFGAHEAYACPEGIEAYDIVFPEKETLYAYALNGDLLTDYTKLIIKDSNVLSLKDEYFYLDALVFRDLKSRSAELINRSNGRHIKVDFEGFDYFLLWHKYNAPYICIEPWCGIQDVAGSSFDLSCKEGIHKLESGKAFSRSHIITIG